MFFPRAPPSLPPSIFFRLQALKHSAVHVGRELTLVWVEASNLEVSLPPSRTGRRIPYGCGFYRAGGFGAIVFRRSFYPQRFRVLKVEHYFFWVAYYSSSFPKRTCSVLVKATSAEERWHPHPLRYCHVVRCSRVTLLVHILFSMFRVPVYIMCSMCLMCHVYHLADTPWYDIACLMYHVMCHVPCVPGIILCRTMVSRV